MAGGIRLTPYTPAGVRTPPVPGGGFQQVDAGAGDFGQAIGQGVQRLGNAVSQTVPLIEQRVARDNEVAVADIDGQARRAITDFLNDPQKGFLTKKGRFALDGSKDAAADIEKLRTTYMGLAQNDDQRVMASRVLGTRFDGALQTINDHARVQGLAYQQTTLQARADNAQADAIAAAADDRAIIMQLKVGGEALDKLYDGQSDEAKAQAMRRWRGETLKGVLGSKMNADPDAASAWYTRNRHLFNPDDYPVIEKQLKDSVEARDLLKRSGAVQPAGWGSPTGAVRVTPTVVEGDPRAVPQQYADAVMSAAKTHGVPVEVLSALFYNESRYRADARNPGDQRGTVNPVTGKPYDSVGIGQWGEQFAQARGFDPKDANASINETAKVLAEHAKKYGGNWALARLAYGMGAGNVDAWLAAGGDPAKLNGDVLRWVGQAITGKDGDAAKEAALALGPKFAGLQNPALGNPAAITTTAKPPPQLNDFIAAADRDYAGADVALREKARAQYTARYQQAHALWADTRAKDLDAAQAWVIKNPGTPVAQMPPAMMLALDLETQQTLKAYAKKVATADDTDANNGADYYRLHGQATSGNANDRQAFAKLNLMEFRHLLSKASFEKLVNLQGEINKSDPSGVVKGEASWRQQQDDALRMLRLDPTPKDGSSDAESVARFRRQADVELDAATKDKDKPLDLKERQAILDRLLTPVVGTGGLFTSDKRRSDLVIKDVPSDLVATWDKTFATEKVTGISDDMRVSMFAAMQSVPALKANPALVADLVGEMVKQGIPVTDASIINSYNFAMRRKAARTVTVPPPDAPPPVGAQDLGVVQTPAAPEPPPVTARELGARTAIERGARQWWQGVNRPSTGAPVPAPSSGTPAPGSPLLERALDAIGIKK